MAKRMAAVAASMDALTGSRQGAGQGGAVARRVVLLGAATHAVTVEGRPGRWRVGFDEAPDVTLELQSGWTPGQPVWQGSVDGEKVAVQVRRTEHGFSLAHAGMQAEARVLSAREAAWLAMMPRKRGADAGSQLRSPCPRWSLPSPPKSGQSVAAGDPLCVVEAMKMEITLGAERSGVVSKVHVGRGDALALDAVIIEFE